MRCSREIDKILEFEMKKSFQENIKRGTFQNKAKV